MEFGTDKQKIVQLISKHFKEILACSTTYKGDRNVHNREAQKPNRSIIGSKLDKGSNCALNV